MHAILKTEQLRESVGGGAWNCRQVTREIMVYRKGTQPGCPRHVTRRLWYGDCGVPEKEGARAHPGFPASRARSMNQRGQGREEAGWHRGQERVYGGVHV